MTADDRDALIAKLLSRPKGGVLRFELPGDAEDPVIIYARRSKKGGTSVQEQVETLCEWAEELGRPIAAIVVEHGSASIYATRDRIHWPTVKAMIEDGDGKLLLTWEHSRADRKLDGFVALRHLLIESGAKWGYGDKIYDMTNSDDRDRTAEDALDAEKEVNKTSKRNRRYAKGAARRGTATQGVPSWGFYREYLLIDGKKVPKQHVNTDLVPVIREVAERLLASEKLARVADDLNKREILSPSGKPWDYTKLRSAITVPALAGLRVHHQVVVGDAEWEPILADDRETAKDIHRQLITMFSDPVRKTYGDGAVKHLCSGIATCGVCGTVCNARRLNKTPIYQCQKYHVGRNQEMVDTIVVGFVLDLLSDPDVVQQLFPPDDDTELINAERKLRELESRLKSFYRAAANGNVSEDGIMEIEAELLPQIKRLKKRIENMHIVMVPPLVGQIAGPSVAERWESLDIVQKRVVLRAVVSIKIKPVEDPKPFQPAPPESIEVRQREVRTSAS